MNLTFKYRLYPTAAQRSALEQTLGACRWVYNQTLEVRQEASAEGGESLSRYDTLNLLPVWEAEQPPARGLELDSDLNAAFNTARQGNSHSPTLAIIPLPIGFPTIGASDVPAASRHHLPLHRH